MRYVKNDYSENERAWLWLSLSLGVKAARLRRRMLALGSPSELYDAVRENGRLQGAGFISEADAKKLASNANDAVIDGFIESLCAKGLYAVTIDSTDYPDLLRDIFDPPAVLYVAGRLRSLPEMPVAVIGSRKCSQYGLEMADFFGRELARHGICVVSGLAVGCDAEAARGALSVAECSYPSVAVLGSGVDVLYPQKNRKLYDEIVERGAVVSELLPGSSPARFNFVQRNRIISGMSRGVLVVEAGEKSGTSITVDFALEHGRDVFAVPGRITDIMSRGTNLLIKRGTAKPVFDIEDILSEYGLSSEMISAASPIKRVDTSGLDAKQVSIYNELLLGEKSIDELCEKTGFSVSELNIYLTEMELSGLIKQLPNKVYSA